MTPGGAFRALFLRGHLSIGVAPGAELEPAADPAQALGGIGSAFGCADHASAHFGKPVRLDGGARLLQQLLRDKSRRDGFGGERAFALHDPTIAGPWYLCGFP